MDYVALGTADQVALLEQLEEDEDSAFARLKGLAVVGYYFSESALSKNAVSIPGYYDDFSLSKVGKRWSS